MTNPWHLYHGHLAQPDPEKRAEWLRPDSAPPWRRPPGPWELRPDQVDYPQSTFTDPDADADRRRAERFRVTGIDGDTAALDRINAALLLRRPLLVTGPPGVGKSSLAYAIAWKLELGRPLRWEVGSRTELQDGLYRYDAVGHLQGRQASDAASIDNFITLGPLGTALLPTLEPRVLLIDELDKASYDLPNDLLHALEERRFEIPELKRDAGPHKVGVVDRPGVRVPVQSGQVVSHHAPVVVITSNDEREFPEAFLRRCVQLRIGRPGRDEMEAIVRGWFDDVAEGDADVHDLVSRYADRQQATDVVLQALYLEREWGADATEVEAAVGRQTAVRRRT